MSNINAIFSTCLFISIIVSLVVSSDFSLKGDPCSKFDSCHSKQIRTCSCDSSCLTYGTCCYDFKKTQQKIEGDAYRCYDRRTVNPVFAKRSCVEDYRGHVDNKLACLDDDEDEMDVKNNLLMTSHTTKITYWNKFCAECNNEVDDDLEFWNIEVFCPPHKDVDRSLIRRNLTFDQDKRQWGLIIDGEFLQCSVKYAPPPYIDEVKHCTPNLVKSCPINYTNEDIVMKCSEYYGERKLKNSDVYYKNIHCAICNNVDVKDLECPGMTTPEDNAEDTDFQEMIEEIFYKGDWLIREPGRRFECSFGFIYDPIREKCRSNPEAFIPLKETFSTMTSSSPAFRKETFAILLLMMFLLFLN